MLPLDEIAICCANAASSITNVFPLYLILFGFESHCMWDITEVLS